MRIKETNETKTNEITPMAVNWTKLYNSKLRLGKYSKKVTFTREYLQEILQGIKGLSEYLYLDISGSVVVFVLVFLTISHLWG